MGDGNGNLMRRRHLAIVRKNPLLTVLFVGFISLLLAAPNAAGVVELGTVLLFPVALAAGGVSTIRRPNVGVGSIAVLAMTAVALLAALSMFADSPAVAWFGNRGQHSGTLLWLGLSTSFAMLVFAPVRGRTARFVKAVALLAALLAVGVVLESMGVLAWVKLAGPSAGLLENPITAAQVLVLGVGSALAWFHLEHGRRLRIVAMGAAVASGVGLAVSDTRSVVVGAVAGAAFVVLARVTGQRLVFRRIYVGAVLALLVIVLLGSALAISWLSPGDSLGRQLDAISNGRVTIWRAAIAKAVASPILGSGPEHFSSWVTWSIDSGGTLSHVGTYDPHNIFLYWLLAAGIPGIVLILGLCAASTWVMLEVVAIGRGRAGIMWIAGCIVAWFTMLTFSWTSGLAALCATGLFGAMAGDALAARGLYGEPSAFASSGIRACLALLVVVSVLGLIALLPTAVAEIEWARAVQSQSLEVGTLLEAANRTHDPVYAVDARSLDASRGKGGLAIEDVRDMLVPAAGWSVDAALSWNVLEFNVAATRSDVSAWEGAKRALDKGRDADSASGLWDAVQALEASALGFEGDAAEAARAAMERSTDASTRMYLSTLLESD